MSERGDLGDGPGDLPNLVTALSEAMRAERQRDEVTQEEVAGAMRELGFLWTRTTVGNLETGYRRTLSAEELLALPLALSVAIGRVVTLKELLRHTGEFILAPTKLVLDGPTAIKWLDGTIARGYMAQLESSPPIDPRIEEGTEVPAFSEVEERAANRLGVAASEVVRLAQEMWGRSLSAERDRRLGLGHRRVGDSDAEQRVGARRLQARRGHMTRALIDELDREIEKRRTGLG